MKPGQPRSRDTRVPAPPGAHGRVIASTTRRRCATAWCTARRDHPPVATLGPCPHARPRCSSRGRGRRSRCWSATGPSWTGSTSSRSPTPTRARTCCSRCARPSRPRRSPAEPDGRSPPALARGALLGARGNSGVILSQVLRGLAEAVAAAGPTRRPTSRGARAAAVLADALARGARLADGGAHRPAGGHGPHRARRGRRRRGGREARTGSTRWSRRRRAAARRRGDRAARHHRPAARAGARRGRRRGRHGRRTSLLDALAALVTDRPPAAAAASGRRGTGAALTAAAARRARPEYDYEVMYLLDALRASAVDGLRARLAELGDSVAVVGDGRDLLARPPALQRHRRRGRGRASPRDGRTGSPWSGSPTSPRRGRFVREPGPCSMIVVGAEVGAAGPRRRSGGAASAPPGAPVAVTSRDRRRRSPAPGARTSCSCPATRSSSRSPSARRPPRAATARTCSSCPPRPCCRACPRSPCTTRRAARGRTSSPWPRPPRAPAPRALLVAETEALTWVGRCEPGDVLGIADGEVVLIAPDLSVGALWLAHRMLLGGARSSRRCSARAPTPRSPRGSSADLRRSHPEVDVVVHRGGQTDYPLVLGVE